MRSVCGREGTSTPTQSVRSLWAHPWDLPALHPVFLEVSIPNASSTVSLPSGWGVPALGDPHPCSRSQIQFQLHITHPGSTPKAVSRNLPKPQHGSAEMGLQGGVQGGMESQGSAPRTHRRGPAKGARPRPTLAAPAPIGVQQVSICC